MKRKGFDWIERRLSHETWLSSMIHLGRMNQEWMAKIHCSRFSGGDYFGAPSGCIEIQIHQRHAGFACRLENSRHIEMRTNPDTRRCILLTDVRKEEKHQQSSAARMHIDVPRREIIGIGVFSGEARVYMPTRITCVLLGRETHRKGAETVAGVPASLSDNLVKGGV